MYDNRFPVYVFGGDTFVGQAMWPLIHRNNQRTDGNGDTNGWELFLIGKGQCLIDGIS